MICEDLKGKKVLVTGASSGIGSATAGLFSEQDCFVGIHYFRTSKGAEKTLQQVKKNSDGVLLSADVRDKKQVNEMVEKLPKKPAASTSLSTTPDRSLTDNPSKRLRWIIMKTYMLLMSAAFSW